MGAAVEYTFSHLFTKKYQEEKNKESQPLADDRLNKVKESLKPANDSLELTKSELDIYKSALTCKCGMVHQTVSRYRNCKHKVLEADVEYTEIKYGS